jgi:hypothetical protein
MLELEDDAILDDYDMAVDDKHEIQSGLPECETPEVKGF